MSFSSVSIPFAHDFESFDFCVDVFNDDSFLRQLAVERFLFHRQRVIFACFVRDSAVFVQLQQPLITTVGQQQNPAKDRPNRRFENLKIMHGPFVLGGAENFLRFDVDDDLRFYRMPFFFAGIPVFLFFLGRSIGLSVTSTARVRPAFSLDSNAFFPGK